MNTAAVLEVSGPLLPDLEPSTFFVVEGKITFERHSNAEKISGWILPGLVDAHCHIGMDAGGATDHTTAEAQAITNRNAGTLLIRDCGSALDTRWMQTRDDLPKLIRAGRHIARKNRYIRNYAFEEEPETLANQVTAQAKAGDGWVKLVGDWIDREVGDLAPSFDDASVTAAIKAAHEHGAKVTAHVFGATALPGLITAGIDCIEHGTGLHQGLLDQMVANQTALVPTVKQLENFPNFAAAGANKFPNYSNQMLRLYENRRNTIAAAYEAGVQIYAGTDAGGILGHGQIVAEIIGLHDYGMSKIDALGAATWRARDWLGHPGICEGAPADFLVLSKNPLEDLTQLTKPKAIYLNGNLINY